MSLPRDLMTLLGEVVDIAVPDGKGRCGSCARYHHSGCGEHTTAGPCECACRPRAWREAT